MCHQSISSAKRAFVQALAKQRPLLLWAGLGLSASVFAQNNQQVVVNGGIVNISGPAAQAVMNISSNKNIRQIRGNNQVTSVNGVVANMASFGAYSELNIASRNGGVGSGSQVVSVGGPVVNQATGTGMRSVVNIGGR